MTAKLSEISAFDNHKNQSLVLGSAVEVDELYTIASISLTRVDRVQIQIMITGIRILYIKPCFATEPKTSKWQLKTMKASIAFGHENCIYVYIPNYLITAIFITHIANYFDKISFSMNERISVQTLVKEASMWGSKFLGQWPRI